MSSVHHADYVRYPYIPVPLHFEWTKRIPRLFLNRGHGILTPLIPADELPDGCQITGLYRAIKQDSLRINAGQFIVGTEMWTGHQYEVQLLRGAASGRASYGGHGWPSTFKLTPGLEQHLNRLDTSLTRPPPGFEQIAPNPARVGMAPGSHVMIRSNPPAGQLVAISGSSTMPSLTATAFASGAGDRSGAADPMRSQVTLGSPLKTKPSDLYLATYPRREADRAKNDIVHDLYVSKYGPPPPPPYLTNRPSNWEILGAGARFNWYYDNAPGWMQARFYPDGMPKLREQMVHRGRPGQLGLVPRLPLGDTKSVCPHWIRTSKCVYGKNCRYNHCIPHSLMDLRNALNNPNALWPDWIVELDNRAKEENRVSLASFAPQESQVHHQNPVSHETQVGFLAPPQGPLVNNLSQMVVSPQPRRIQRPPPDVFESDIYDGWLDWKRAQGQSQALNDKTEGEEMYPNGYHLQPPPAAPKREH